MLDGRRLLGGVCLTNCNRPQLVTATDFSHAPSTIAKFARVLPASTCIQHPALARKHALEASHDPTTSLAAAPCAKARSLIAWTCRRLVISALAPEMWSARLVFFGPCYPSRRATLGSSILWCGLDPALKINRF